MVPMKPLGDLWRIQLRSRQLPSPYIAKLQALNSQVIYPILCLFNKGSFSGATALVERAKMKALSLKKLQNRRLTYKGDKTKCTEIEKKNTRISY